MYIIVVDNVIEHYTITELKKANSNISFPTEISDETLAEFNVFRLFPTDPPIAEVVSEGLPIFNEELQRWEQSWIFRDFTIEELEEQLLKKRQNMIVSMRQARLALLQVGILSQVEAAISSLQEPTRSALQIEWEYSATFERMNPWVLQLALDVLNLSEEEVDSLFELAKEL